jgi:hypothetical protein
MGVIQRGLSGYKRFLRRGQFAQQWLQNFCRAMAYNRVIDRRSSRFRVEHRAKRLRRSSAKQVTLNLVDGVHGFAIDGNRFQSDFLRYREAPNSSLC